ncbi:hypothetical protein Lal_00049523 [Lupinus albus]|nr:hypothetical protein Lal_00049523 [Lupinus albus]
MSSESIPGRTHSFLLQTPDPYGQVVLPTRESKRAFQYAPSNFLRASIVEGDVFGGEVVVVAVAASLVLDVIVVAFYYGGDRTFVRVMNGFGFGVWVENRE